MRTIYYTQEDLKARILQVRDSIDLLHEQEADLVLLHAAIEGKEDCVIDNNAKIIKLGPRGNEKPKQTYYKKNQPRQDMIRTYEGRIAQKPAWIE